MSYHHSGHHSFRTFYRRILSLLPLLVASLFSGHSFAAALEPLIIPGLTLVSSSADQSAEVRLMLGPEAAVIPAVSDIRLPAGTPASVDSFSLAEHELTLQLTPAAGTVRVEFDGLLINYRGGPDESVFIGPTEVNWLDAPFTGNLVNPEVLASPSERAGAAQRPAPQSGARTPHPHRLSLRSPSVR